MSELRQFRVIGPPGCGKTTWLSGQVRRAVEKFGPHAVAVVSFSRAAAAVVAGRDTGLAEDRVGTLHAFGRRAVASRGAIKGVADTPAGMKEWNKVCRPDFRLSGGVGGDEDAVRSAPASGAADMALSEIMLARASRGAEVGASLKPFARAFYEDWRRWKAAEGWYDFQDFIELPALTGEPCPGNPMCLFADEAQDFSRTQWQLVRMWGEQANTFVTVGDPDQVLYGWAGVDPDDFYHPELPDSQVRVLEQSYRVPRAVHALAVDWIEQTPGRVSIEYKPKDHDGRVLQSSVNHSDAGGVIDLAQDCISRGRTCAVIASASYMLDPWIAEARVRGIPFHNPFRASEKRWNPLGDGESVTAAMRLHALLKPSESLELWNWRELGMVFEWLNSDVLHHGAKAQVDRLYDSEGAYLPISGNFDDPINRQDLLELAPRSTWLALLAGDVDWFKAHLLASHAAKLDYPHAVYRSRGWAALVDEPRLVFGTIHSVKGGEADSVILSPALSHNAARVWFAESEESPEHQEIRRVFYVGITRAADTLHVLSPPHRNHVELF